MKWIPQLHKLAFFSLQKWWFTGDIKVYKYECHIKCVRSLCLPEQGTYPVLYCLWGRKTPLGWRYQCSTQSLLFQGSPWLPIVTNGAFFRITQSTIKPERNWISVYTMGFWKRLEATRKKTKEGDQWNRKAVLPRAVIFSSSSYWSPISQHQLGIRPVMGPRCHPPCPKTNAGAWDKSWITWAIPDRFPTKPSWPCFQDPVHIGAGRETI